jgi:hypothetical protein
MKTKLFLAILIAPVAIFSQINFAKNGNQTKSAADNTVAMSTQKGNTTQSLSNDIKLSLVASWTTDSMRISFLSNATSSFDSGLDVLKSAPSNTVDPYISSVNSALDLGRNALPSSQMAVTIPIRVKVGVSGKYILTMDSNAIMLSNACIMLEDISFATTQDMKANPSYSFVISDTTDAPRFLLHIGQAPVKSAFAPTCSYNQNGMAIVTGNGTGAWDCTWLDSLGNILVSNSGIIGADTLKNLAPGVYPIIVNGNSGYCNSTFNDTIRVVPAADLSVFSIITNVNCPSANTGIVNAVSISGGQAPYSYNWSNGGTAQSIQNLSAGVYILVLSDANGCKDTTMYAVQMLSNLSVNFSMSNDTLTMANPTVTFSNQTTGQTNLSWNFGDASPATNNYSPSHTYGSGGTFTVELTANDASCVIKQQKVLVVLSPTGINGVEMNTAVNVFKHYNEAMVKFNLTETKDASIYVYDLAGKLINTKDCIASTNTETITLGESNGIYIIQVEIEGNSITKKIIK